VKQKLQYLVLGLRCYSNTILVPRKKFYCLRLPPHQILLNITHDVIAPWTLSIDWKGFAEERITLEPGSASYEISWIM